MGLYRDFYIYAEHKNGTSVNKEEDSAIFKSLEEKYDGWEGSLSDKECLHISGVNWYDWDSDMRDLSREFPDILFTLHCDGMSLNDTWEAGFCDGRSDVQYAYIPELNTAWLLTGKEPDTWN